jgi:hypothetical protein
MTASSTPVASMVMESPQAAVLTSIPGRMVQENGSGGLGIGGHEHLEVVFFQGLPAAFQCSCQ